MKNIILILTDDQRYDTINYLFGGQIKTPVMDQLAREGCSFTEATIMGGTQPAVCCPSRNMLLTGRRLYDIEGNGYQVAPDVVTLPQLLRENGYDSYHVGKWHQDHAAHRRSFNGGKSMAIINPTDSKFHKDNSHFTNVTVDYREDGKYTQDDIKYAGIPFETMVPPYMRYSDYTHSSTVYTDAAIDIIRERKSKKDKPFFLFLAYTAPHDPRQYPTRFFELYKKEEMELPPNYKKFHPFDNGDMFVRDELLEGYPRLPWRIREQIRDYYGIISHLDEEIGRVVKELKETGEWENSIIVFAGDNGLAVGQHGLMGKQNVYEHSIRVPLIMIGPGIPADSRRSTKCYLSDIYPTICDMIGIDAPTTVTGKSFKKAFDDEEFELRDCTYHGYMHYMRAMRKGDYKIILYHVGDRFTVQLFNVKKDRYETENLGDKPEYRSLLMKMFKEIHEQSMENRDFTPQGNDFWRGFERFIKSESFTPIEDFSPTPGADRRGGRLCWE